MKSNSLEFLAFLDLKQIRVRIEDRERILSTGQTNRLLLFRLTLLLVLLLLLVVDVCPLPGLHQEDRGVPRRAAEPGRVRRDLEIIPGIHRH